MKDMFKMMGKVREMQSKLQEAQDELEQIIAEAEAGAGMVKATVNGKHRVVKIEIDNDLIKPDDKEMMNDLIIAAINKAMELVEEKSREHIQKSTASFLPNMEGFDLDKLMGGGGQ
ncbi:MAG: YbaB/EbfC family nucleoid-associated protein [Bernardetiaceae bacterium]